VTDEAEQASISAMAYIRFRFGSGTSREPRALQRRACTISCKPCQRRVPAQDQFLSMHLWILCPHFAWYITHDKGPTADVMWTHFQLGQWQALFFCPEWTECREPGDFVSTDGGTARAARVARAVRKIMQPSKATRSLAVARE